jgi:hypothetical protein
MKSGTRTKARANYVAKLFVKSYKSSDKRGLSLWRTQDSIVKRDSLMRSREPAHLTSSRAMVIKPILAEEIGEYPCCSGNREGLDGFAPIRMTAGSRKQQRYPHA